MRWHRTVPAALAALALTCAAVLLVAGGSSAEPSASQQLFRKTLLDDARTTSAVKQLLRDRGGFVVPEIEFADLTGDGRSDAVVLVETAGAAGAVAMYVFSTDGRAESSPLRAVYRSQQLYRARVELSGETLILRTPRYAAGDDVCCPAKVIERVYFWHDTAKTLRQRSTREVAGPTGASGAARTTPPAG